MPDPFDPLTCPQVGTPHARHWLHGDRSGYECPGEPAPQREVDPVCTDAPGCPCGCVSDVEAALSTLDDLTADFDALAAEDVDALDAWANNIQLDIMRHRRLRNAPHSPAEPVSPVSTPTEARGETGEAQGD